MIDWLIDLDFKKGLFNSTDRVIACAQIELLSIGLVEETSIRIGIWRLVVMLD